jgi:hypothetical protein
VSAADLPTAKELGERICAHLKRFEADPVLNAEVERRRMKLRPFFNVSAFGERKYVFVSYVAYQGISKLSREQAAEYLAWLDAGNVGSHRQAGVSDSGSVSRY